ncbi:NUDIX hydrolase [Paraglaciecola psychrophila]|uniref:MutT/nudix family protein n=1 Tax=Paraglaciecola psychrophila 170 TaxID=1129794 RepID=K6YSW3_9ALTE|nr:NUDIX domain-containing protein [Paraglaciecola psychrophila]AGH46073.1 MutT/nudix family protein [Paraglaciecola psychrophila 170]GAC35784.1 MutT/nudix family protein [Paraglaciecola psychrophila 170]
MQLLKTAFHPDVAAADISAASELRLIERHAARAIDMKGDDILLIYTERYYVYSLPGGGIDDREDEVAGLKRVLQEETGAQGIRNVKAFARYDDYRPWYKPDADIIHMISYCYVCKVDEKLCDSAFESMKLIMA